MTGNIISAQQALHPTDPSKGYVDRKNQLSGSQTTSEKSGKNLDDNNWAGEGTGSIGGVYYQNEQAESANTMNNGIQKTRNITNEAIDNTSDLAKQQKAVQKTELDPQANNNFSKNGRYGNLNNMSYNETLARSRQADAYNNAPVDKMSIGGNFATGTGSYDMGQVQDKYERPKIETQEMRQMRANEDVDATQRQSDVQLQSLINKKDYDSYIQEFAQKYNLRLTEAEKQQAIAAMHYSANIQSIVSQHRDYFNTMLGLYEKSAIGNFLWEQYLKNPLFASMIAQTLSPGSVMPSISQGLQNSIFQDIRKDAEIKGLDQAQVMQAFLALTGVAGRESGNAAVNQTKRSK